MPFDTKYLEQGVSGVDLQVSNDTCKHVAKGGEEGEQDSQMGVQGGVPIEKSFQQWHF